MSGHGEKLSRKQEQAISGLLSSRTVAEAAMVAGVGESTLRRWLKDERFIEEFRLVRRQCMSAALSNFSRICGDAISTLDGIMRDAAASPSSRVAAAKAVLDVAFKVSEQDELEVRIARVETILDRDSEQ